MIFMMDHYVHDNKCPSLTMYILAWVADGSGLCLLMIIMRDHYVHNTKHPSSALQGCRCCKTVFSPVCCNNKHNIDLRVGSNTGKIDLIKDLGFTSVFYLVYIPVWTASSAYIIYLYPDEAILQRKLLGYIPAILPTEASM